MNFQMAGKVIVFCAFNGLTTGIVILIGHTFPFVLTQIQAAGRLRISANNLAIIAVGTHFTDIKIDHSIFGNIDIHYDKSHSFVDFSFSK